MTKPRSPTPAAVSWSLPERLAFGALALLRVLACVLLLGMVHPDEFFQSQEVMARHVLAQSDSESDRTLRAQLFLPWEYQLPTPNRSVLFPALVAGVPYQLMLWLGVKPTGFLLLVVPRVLLCVASFSVDYLLYRIATKLRFQDPARVVLCFASSWPTLVLLTRTFSNTFETLVLALCFAVLLLCDPHKRVGLRGVYHLQTLLLGALLAVGFFTRFTFVFFFFPLGLELVRSQDVLYTESASKKADHQTSIIKRVMATLFVALQGLLAFAVCSAVFIVVDTVYFRPEMASDYYQQWLTALDRQTLLKKLVIAPLNNLLYNLQYENLELHGVHARVTHFAVNMPMLFGPLFFRFVINVVTGNASNGNTHMPRHRQLFAVASVLFPLACISTAPHQEPRFLLPLLIPLQIFFASGLLVKRRVVIVIWIVFNVALTVFFGVLHQGGVVPMLLSFSTANGQGMSTTALSYLMPSTCHFTGDATKLMGAIPIVFYKTYMPPRFLLAGMKASSSFQVVDLAGGSADTIATQLQQIQRQISKSPSYQVFLVAPASVSVDPIVKSSQVSVSTRVGSCGPHISTEDLALDQPFALELYLLEMAEAE